ncbi:MAG: hypothetical protein ABIB47_03250 [Candidatus Woesearchaeota archaeon]
MAKGQAALEFVMTYGWAILAVLVTIGSLAYFGVLNSVVFLSSSCILAPGFSCEDFKIEDTGGLYLVLRNGLGKTLNNVNVQVTSCTSSTEADSNDEWSAGSILGGSDGIILTSCSEATSSSKFSGDITITYVEEGGGISHSVSGKITAKVEASAGGATAGSGGEECNPCFDLNGDGWIDILEFGIFGSCSGKCYSPGDSCYATNFDCSPDGCIDENDFSLLEGCIMKSCEECGGPPGCCGVAPAPSQP